MTTVQAYYTQAGGWHYITDKEPLRNPLVIVFGDRLLLDDDAVIENIRQEFDYEHMIYGSTAGEIAGLNVLDNSLSVMAIEFEKSQFIIRSCNISEFENEEKLGAALYSKMPHEGLKHLLLISAGSFINSSLLIKGIEANAPHSVAITGGVCGDAGRFAKTIAGYNKKPLEGEVVLVGLYGASLEVSYASYGGFQPFGPERTITKAEGNVVHEIDGQPAIELYNRYLAEKSENVMISRLAFPLNIIQPNKDYPVVRTVLDIENNDGSIVLAGNCEQGSRAQLMMSSVHGIVEGANEAAKFAMQGRKSAPEVALLVSCMGRKAIMGFRTDEEIELVSDVIGNNVPLAGFYSYAEMAPVHDKFDCEVHNQTMTLTLLSE